MNKDRRIDRLLDAIEQAFAGIDSGSVWPCRVPQIEAYYSDIIAVELFEKFLKDQGRFKKALAQVKVDTLRTSLYSCTIIGLKVARKYEGYKLNNDDFIDFIISFCDVIKDNVWNDEFCADGRNLILGPKEIAKILKEKNWQEAEEEGIQREMAALNIGTESLTWALYFDAYRCGGMYLHGPYETPRGNLIIRDFYDLNPPFWKTNNRFPVLQTLLIYEKDIEAKIDFMDHILYKEPVVKKLRQFVVIANKPLKTKPEIEDLDEYYSELRQKQVKKVESLPPIEIVKKGAEIYYYLFKDFYGEDWLPPKKFYNRVDRLGLKYWRRFNTIKKRPASYFRKLYDPRNDFC